MFQDGISIYKCMLVACTNVYFCCIGVPDEIEDMAPVFAPASAEERKVIGLGLAQFVRPPTHHFRLTKNVNKEEDKEYYDFLTTQKRALTIIGTYGMRG